MKNLLCTVTALAIILVSISIDSAAGSSISVTVNTPAEQKIHALDAFREENSKHTKIEVDISIQNISNEDLTIGYDIGDTGAAFLNKIHLSAADGHTLKMTSFGKEIYFDRNNDLKTSFVEETLSPGQVLTQKFNLASIYKITSSGMYSVQVTSHDPVEAGHTVSSNVATFHVEILP